MWLYEKKLEYPVKIKRPNPALAKFIISQVGGPDGEMGAATRYLQQRYSMPYAQVKGMLTDIGTEELAHIEMVSAIIYQLTRCMTPEEIKRSGFDTYFVDHTAGVYPQAASGYPFSTSELQVSGDTLADLYEDLAAEQKARKTYDNILRLADDPDVRDPIKFLREREVVHFQRFGDALRITQENLDAKNFYAFNPSFDKKCNPPQKLFSPPCTPDAVAAPACGCAQQAQPCQPCQPCAQPRLLRAGQQRLRVRMCGSRRGACLRMRERDPGHRLRMRGRRDGNDLRLCRRCGPRLRMRRRDAREAGLRLCGDPAGLQLLCAQSDRHEQLLLRAPARPLRQAQ